MHILELHELARQELHGLLTQRYMPRGWNRDADRTVTLKLHELQAHLDKVLAVTPDRLVTRPTDAQCLAIHTRAQCPRLGASVAKMVTLLEQLPLVDQQDAYGVSKVTEHILLLNRVSGKLADALQELTAEQTATLDAGVDLGPAIQELTDLTAALQRQSEELERSRADLERDIAARKP